MLADMKCANCAAALQVDLSVGVAVCQFCDSEFIIDRPKGAEDTAPAPAAKTVFALWEPDGYYYPAKVGEAFNNLVKADFLDGSVATLSTGHIIELDEALATLAFQGNWEYGGIFYKGTIANTNPLVMNYDDGEVEMIELVQLRGSRRGSKKKTRFF
ncbi:MAG: hypothetical protein LBE55_00375 [Clostridiales bacterium]|jgi:hypothetical protein|nr:hypothetical protein [Clostridiales bacterium]